MPRAAGTAESVQETCRARPHPAWACTQRCPVLTAAEAIFIRLHLQACRQTYSARHGSRLDGVGFAIARGVHQQAWGELERVEAESGS